MRSGGFGDGRELLAANFTQVVAVVGYLAIPTRL